MCSSYAPQIFDLLSNSQRIGLFAGSALMMALSTVALTWLYSVVNGKDVKDVVAEGVTRPKRGNAKGE